MGFVQVENWLKKRFDSLLGKELINPLTMRDSIKVDATVRSNESNYGWQLTKLPDCCANRPYSYSRYCN